MVSNEHKCIFIHPPRNGGTSIERSLFKCSRRARADHRNPKAILEELGDEKFNNYFKFGFARNTWDRLTSCYRYDIQRRKNEFGRVSFREWIYTRTILNKTSATSGYHKRGLHGLQTKDFFSLNGKFCMDFVGSFENYKEDWEKVCETLNVNVTLPHANRTRKEGSYTSYYNKELKVAVEEEFKEEIDFFGFKFDE